MSQDDSNGGESSRREPTKEHRESWTDRFLVAIGLRPPTSIRDDLEEALEETGSDDADAFSPEEKRILRNILTARGKRVQDVMVARGAIIAVSEIATFGELRGLFASAGHSRLPVYGETLDDPKGMVHIRDMFARLDGVPLDARLVDIDLIRPILFAPGSMPALDLLLEMQAKRIHMALVIDEYGGTDGLVSIEDVIEIIVGEIEDEHDVSEDAEIEVLPGGALAINASAPLAEVEDRLAVRLTEDGEAHEVGTIGGYVTAVLGRVPHVGETVTMPDGIAFTVLDGDGRRLRRLRIALAGEEAGAE